jgi:hypothetical protein
MISEPRGGGREEQLGQRGDEWRVSVVLHARTDDGWISR